MFSFFALHSRMKYINRWALMRNTQKENLSEHSNDVAAIAHALALIKNERFGGNVNAERCAVLGLYHDMPEIITGDMPTPVKYHSGRLKAEYEEVETQASETLLSSLPDDLKPHYSSLFFKQKEDEELWKIVKAADKISALIKCVEESSGGNGDFRSALESTCKAISNLNMPEADAFLSDFMSSFSMTLDELSGK